MDVPGVGLTLGRVGRPRPHPPARLPAGRSVASARPASQNRVARARRLAVAPPCRRAASACRSPPVRGAPRGAAPPPHPPAAGDQHRPVMQRRPAACRAETRRPTGRRGGRRAPRRGARLVGLSRRHGGGPTAVGGGTAPTPARATRGVPPSRPLRSAGAPTKDRGGAATPIAVWRALQPPVALGPGARRSRPAAGLARNTPDTAPQRDPYGPRAVRRRLGGRCRGLRRLLVVVIMRRARPPRWLRRWSFWSSPWWTHGRQRGRCPPRRRRAWRLPPSNTASAVNPPAGPPRLWHVWGRGAAARRRCATCS